MKIKCDSFEEFLTETPHHKYYQDFSHERPTWEEIIDNLDRNISDNLKFKSTDNFGFAIHDTRDILQVYPLLKKIQFQFPSLHVSSHLYVSLSKSSETLGKHRDVMDVIVWQCIGITHWEIYDDKLYEYNLKPGDFLYIPKKMYHNTTPITPRVSISFGIGNTPIAIQGWTFYKNNWSLNPDQIYTEDDF
jgi:hypothetical protein